MSCGKPERKAVGCHFDCPLTSRSQMRTAMEPEMKGVRPLSLPVGLSAFPATYGLVVRQRPTAPVSPSLRPVS
jgi:hypothetical protein